MWRLRFCISQQERAGEGAALEKTAKQFDRAMVILRAADGSEEEVGIVTGWEMNSIR